MHYKGDWLVGFGWDQNNWPNGEYPDRKILDDLYPGKPVFFSRADGHAFWVSTEALKRADLFHCNPKDPEGGKIITDQSGWPTGVLIDLAGLPVENLIPKSSVDEAYKDLKISCDIFNLAGITHIRDMSCDETQWHASLMLAERNELSLAVEQCFSADHPDDFSKAIQLARNAKKNSHKLIRPHAIKVYFDGALGSEGAYLSEPYASGSGRGLVLIERIALKEMMAESWSLGFDFAVHAIGDEAIHQVASVASELWAMGEEGRLHIEHAEVMRTETIQLLKSKSVVCHLQPCHWLTDKQWLEAKIGSLFKYAFPWADLESEGIQFYFGSDSPIEEPSIKNNILAIHDSKAHGIRAPKHEATHYQSHRDLKWTPETYTEFQNLSPSRTVFLGKEILH